MRQVLVHLHIPKCGGATVVDFLSRNLGDGLTTTNSVLNDYQYTSDQVAKIIEQRPGLRCLTGHKLSLDLPFDRADLQITALTWVRDPVDRFVSHYFYHRNHTTLVPEAKSLPPDEYARWALEDGNQPMYVNGQVRFLAGGDLDLIRSRADDGDLLLFPLERLEESFYTLASRYPDWFWSWGARTRNVSEKDRPITEELRECVAPFVQDDYRLLELARETELLEPPREGSSATGIHAARKAASVLRKVASGLERIESRRAASSAGR